MAYFPNGTAFEHFQSANCQRCKHYRDLGDGRGIGCPVIDIHFLFSYEHGASSDTGDVKACLDILIPQKGPGDLGTCSMFMDDGKDHDTLTLPGLK